jgi:hypothetical protein
MINVINWPESNNYFKFIQLAVDDESYIVFGARHRYHFQILKDTLEGLGVEYEFDPGDGEVIPKVSGKRYRAIGMGDDSAGYSLSTNVDQMNQLQSQFPDWKIGLMKIIY